MRLTVHQENLAKALASVSRVASSRASLPVLSNVLLRTSGNRLTVAATNLDIAITEHVGAKVTTQGAITVPARLMQDFVASLPPGQLKLDVDGVKLHIEAERFSSTINGMPADEFPAMPTIDNAKELIWSAPELKQTLSQVLFAASTDETRPVLTGVTLQEQKGHLICAATDSYRLAEKRLSNKTEAGLNVLLPASSLAEVSRAIKDESSDVVMTYDDNQARFMVDEVEIVTRLVDGQYPEYGRLLPSSFETTAVVERSAITEITKVSSLFARESAGSVTLNIDAAKKQVSINSIASQVGENTASAEAEVDGDAVITLNSRYIMDALNAFNGKQIKININGKLDPCVFTDPQDESYLHVIMPVKS